jgi:hypothetical protein
MAFTAGDWKQSLSLNGQILASGQVATLGIDTTIYQVPTGKQAKIATAIISNTGSTDTTLSLHVIPGSSSLGPTHKVYNAIPLAAGAVIHLPLEGAFLETNAILSVNVGVSAAVNYLITGVLSA